MTHFVDEIFTQQDEKWEALKSQVSDIMGKFSFSAPTPITIKWSFEWGFLRVVLVLSTRDARPGRHAVEVHITNQVEYNIQRVPDDKLESYIKAAVGSQVRVMWMHEMDEWLKYDGVSLDDPHSREEP